MAKNWWEDAPLVEQKSDEWWKTAPLFKAEAAPVVPAKREERPEDQSFLRQVADVPLKVGAGAVTGVRMIADAFGADTNVGKTLRGVEGYIADLYSAQSKKDSQEIGRIMKEAEDKGVLDQVAAGVKAFSVAPVDMVSNALGTAAPAILAGLATTLGGAPAAAATAARLGVGAMMGAGTTKGAIYDATKDILKEKTDLSDKEIEVRAVAAQEYGGKNLDQILIGTGLGALGSATAVEPMLARQLAKGIASKESVKEAIKQSAAKDTATAAKRGVVKQGAITGGKELATEFPQGAQEQLAQNIAQQREGFDTPTMRGVVGQGTLEGLAGLGMGAATGGREAYTAKRELAAEKPADETQKSLFTTENETKKREVVPPTADDLGLLAPITDKAGKSLVDAAPDTLAAKEKADADATAAAEAAKVSLDEATAQANDYLAKIDAGNAIKQPEYRKVAKALGVKIPVGTTNPAAVQLIRDHLAQQGAPSAATTGTDESATGASTSLVGQSSTVVTPAGAKGAKPGRVVPAATTTQSATTGKGTQPAPLTPAATKTAAQQDDDLLNDLLGGGGSSLSARRTNAEIARDEQLNKLGTRYGLSRSVGESVQEFGARIKDAIEFEKMREGKPLSELSDQDIAKQSLREETSYIPPDLQIEEYEAQREKFNETVESDEEKLPAYKELSDDDRRVYFQEGIARPGAGSAQEHSRAAQKLSDYRSGKKDETFEGETQSQNIYNRERDAFGRKTGLSYGFPIWGSLSDASKKLFASLNKTNTILEQDTAFRAVKKQIQKEKAEQASTEFLAQAEVDATREMLAAAARARKSQPAGKGDVLPDNILEKLLAGDTAAVLDYIKERGNGLKLKKGYDLVPFVGADGKTVLRRGVVNIRDSIAMGVFRNLAAKLLDVEGLKVNVVYDENMVYDQLARYDSATNTMYVGPNGLDEATILHELTHAATVKIIHQFFTDASVLSERSRKAVEQLINIAAAAQKRLGSKYPNAFENLYEFIAYAMTDMDFQFDLSQIQVGSLAQATAKETETFSPIQTELEAQREATGGAKQYDGLMDNLWNSFTGTLAYMYKLFRPRQTTTKMLLPTEKSRATTAKTTKTAVQEKAKEEIGAGKLAEDEGKKEEELSLAEKEALAPEELFDNPDVEMKEAKIKPLKDEMVVQNGLANLKRETLREPGYKGNLLLEAAAMFDFILEAPEGGITQLAGKQSIGSELYATSTQSGPAANVDVEEGEKQPERVGGIDDPKNREFYKPKGKEKITSKTGEAWKAIRTATGWRDIVRRFQDKSVESRSLHKKLAMAKLINRDMNGAFNNFDEQRDLSTGLARNFVNQYLRQPMDSIKQSIGDYAKLTGKTIDEVTTDLHMFAEMFHEPERRHFKWLRSVPLSLKQNLMHNGKKISAAQRRIDILGDPRTGKPGIVDRVELTKAQQQQLRAELEYLAKNFADPVGDSPRIKSDKVRDRLATRNKKAGKLGIMDTDENASVYNVLGINKAEVDLRMSEYKAMDPERRKLLDKIFADAKVITDNTAKLDKIGNYWSFPVSNLVGLYDYKHYMPFKGISKHSVVDQYLSFDSEATGKDLQDIAHSADGRFSVSDNPFMQMMSDAFRSAGRAGRRDYMQSIKNAVKPNKYNPTGTGVIDGEVAKHIEFAERNIVDLTDYKGGNNIFVYNSDGSIDIIRIKEPKILNALRYSFRDASPMLDMANSVTGFFGAMHTRYNYNFAPLNFVRDALTNAWNIGASKLGPAKSLTYIKQISAAVVKNGLGKGMEVALLREKGDPTSNRILADMAAKDPFVRDMLEYLKFGGKTTYLESFSLKSSLQDLNTKLGKRRIMDKVDSFNEFVDVWNDMFEFTSRTAAYSLYKQEVLKKNIADGMSNEKGPNGEMSPAEVAAAWEAAAWTKNLANFEKAGEYAREMGALYMFIRASATGAVRAAEAVIPAFRSMKSAIEDLPPEITGNKEALEKFKKEYALEQRNATIMIGALIGMGFFAYWMSALMAPDDEWKRNNVKHDNMQQWTRFARFHIPNEVSQQLGIGRDVVFQLPWGFGLGAFAAIGSQLAGLTVGNNSVKDALSNTVTSLSDSFLPIPVSKIPPLESPESSLKWAADTVTPTVFRPVLEYLMNTNGIGQAINSAQNRRMGDAFTGGDRIPEIYKQVAKDLFNSTSGAIDWSPNTLYFFSNSYLDGLAKIGEIGYSWANLGQGKKEFNLKQDVPLMGSFFGTKTNVDSREYGNIETRIRELDKRLSTLDEVNPGKAALYDAENPLSRALVDAYKSRQGELNALRAEANQIRNMAGLSPKSRDAMLRMVVMQQNILKHQMVMDFKAYGEKP